MTERRTALAVLLVVVLFAALHPLPPQGCARVWSDPLLATLYGQECPRTDAATQVPTSHDPTRWAPWSPWQRSEEPVPRPAPPPKPETPPVKLVKCH